MFNTSDIFSKIVACLSALDTEYLQRYLDGHNRDMDLIGNTRCTSLHHQTMDKSIAFLSKGVTHEVAGLSIACIMQMLPALESGAAVSYMSLAIQRQKIMLFHNLAVQWLDKMVSTHVPLALKTPSRPNHWVQAVAFDFYTAIMSGTSSFNFHPPTALRELANCRHPYKWVRT